MNTFVPDTVEALIEFNGEGARRADVAAVAGIGMRSALYALQDAIACGYVAAVGKAPSTRYYVTERGKIAVALWRGRQKKRTWRGRWDSNPRYMPESKPGALSHLATSL